MTVRILLVDDHPVVRSGLRLLLGTIDDVEVVGESADGAAAVRDCLLLRPDVVLMDLTMPVMGGIEATRRIRAAQPEVAVLILTMSDDDATLLTALRAGAGGYLLKEAGQEDIMAAIRAVSTGQTVLGVGLAQRMLAAGETTPILPELTPREREILTLVADGLRTAAIAERLYLSPKTVSNNLTSIFAKLGVTDRAQAMIIGRQHGLGRP
jgi:DNA-binding NarL/FixJ family response regulator